MGKYNRVFGYDTDYYNSGNPYSDPQGCGLELLGVAQREPDYDFTILALFRDLATKELFLAFDSGCSCPVPFEDFRGLADMSRVKSLRDFDKVADHHGLGSDEYYGIPSSEIRALRVKVSRILGQRKRAATKGTLTT